jgi:AcrR family transcriptional regulator
LESWYARAVTTPRADRRSQIVQVAFQLIAERGLEGLRFADVARQAGINNGTLLYYFASKDALVEAVGGYLVAQFSETAEPRGGTPPTHAVDQIRWEFADAAQRLHSDLGLVYLELLTRSQRDTAVAAVLHDIDAAWRGWLSSILEGGRQTGAFRADIDIGLVATTIMTAIRGVGIQALAEGDIAEVEPVMAAFAALIEGWIASGMGGAPAGIRKPAHHTRAAPSGEPTPRVGRWT